MTAAVANAPRIAAVGVCVVRAGSAGSTAAIAAARMGASLLPVDRLPFLGGTSTAVLDTFYGFHTPGSMALLRDRLRTDGAILELAEPPAAMAQPRVQAQHR